MPQGSALPRPDHDRGREATIKPGSSPEKRFVPG
jgi:hypothetical protein